MFAIVHQRVGAELFAQPDVERQIAMGRHQGRVVIGVFGVDIVAARGLNPDDHVAELVKAEMEVTVLNERIVGRRSPAIFHLETQIF